MLNSYKKNFNQNNGAALLKTAFFGLPISPLKGRYGNPRAVFFLVGVDDDCRIDFKQDIFIHIPFLPIHARLPRHLRRPGQVLLKELYQILCTIRSE